MGIAAETNSVVQVKYTNQVHSRECHHVLVHRHERERDSMLLVQKVSRLLPAAGVQAFGVCLFLDQIKREKGVW